MRTWGRITDEHGQAKWIAVEADEKGDFSWGWLTTLIQTLKLSLGESPFYAQYGMPTQQSIVTQIHPDYYVNITQQQFAGYFASLSISKTEGADRPTYEIQAVFLNGASFSERIAV
ncbi:hypothetical protein J2125_004207 [Erwinia toletana]|uniref:Uncharacterized protein n=1 Tax=Winslowiella toletana TaxID=92490 RepID=A0ABS4PEG4_9GAMM|nr:hypothetical protein [Winslowiella toletana]MBP2171015.1 hypothetical protein [Winslowiella toletana]